MRINRSRKILSKYIQKKLQIVFHSHEKLLKAKQLYNSQNNVVYVPKKMRKLEVPEERLFCKIEAFPTQIMVSVAILKAGESTTKVNDKYCCNVLLNKMIPEISRLAKHKQYLFM